MQKESNKHSFLIRVTISQQTNLSGTIAISLLKVEVFVSEEQICLLKPYSELGKKSRTQILRRLNLLTKITMCFAGLSDECSHTVH